MRATQSKFSAFLAVILLLTIPFTSILKADDATDLVQEGTQLFKDKKYDDAAAKMEQAVKLNPQLTDAWSTLGWCRFRTGDFDKAEAAFTQALTLDPKSGTSLNGIGETNFARGKLDKAEFYLKQNSSTNVARRYLARIYMLESRWDDAAADAQAMLDNAGSNQNLTDFAQRILDAAKNRSLPDDLRKTIAPALAVRSTASSLSPGWVALDQDDLRRAREAFTQILQINATDIQAGQTILTHEIPRLQFADTPLTDALDNLRNTTGVNINVNWKQFKEAGVDKQTLVKLDLHDTPLSKILTSILQQLGPGKFDYTIDTNAILVTTADQANQADAFNGLGWVDLRSGDLDAAVKDFTSAAAQNNPEQRGARNGLATVYFQQGKIDHALQVWQQLVQDFPGVNSGTYGLAQVYAAKGDLDKAADLFDQYVQANPDDQVAKTKLIEVRKKLAATTAPDMQAQNAQDLAHEAAQLLRKRDYSGAGAKCDAAIKIDPTLAEAWITLGWTRFFSGDSDAAQDAFQQAIQLQPKNPTFLNALGQFYFDADRLDKSEEYYAQVASDPQACLILTQICLLESKWDDAAGYAQKFLNSPQAFGEDADDAQAMLTAAKSRALPDDLRQKISPPPLPPQQKSTN